MSDDGERDWLAHPRSLQNEVYDYLGLNITDGGEGWVEVTLSVRPELINGDGALHGGMWAVVADSSMGGALRTVIDGEREKVVTAQLDVRWMRPAHGDALRSVGELLRRGRTLSHLTAELFDGRGELVGSATGTFMVVLKD